MKRGALAALAVAGVTIGVGLGVALREGRSPSRDAPVAPPAPPDRPLTPPAPAAAPPAPAPEAAAPPPAGDPLHDWRHSGDPDEDPEALGRLPTRIDYPLLEKYTGVSLSDVPHTLIAAWDEEAEHPEPGTRRMFIAVVPPGLSDGDLERLLRDAFARHRDARTVGLRVFDSVEAAHRPSWTDGGASRETHLVAELRYNERNERPWIRVRGRQIER